MVQSLDDARRRSRSGGDRVPPHNVQAEESLIGAMLLSRDAIAAAVEVCGVDDFYKPAHGHVYEAVCSLYSQGEPADPVTVADELRRAGLLDAIGGLPTLISLQSNTPATANAGRYARIVEEHALLRRLIGVAGEIAEMGYSLPDDVEAAVDRAESLVFGVAERRMTDTLKPLRELLAESLDRLEALYGRGESITGVPTGFTDLDERLSGLQRSALVIVGARPAMGKCVAWDTRLVDPVTGDLATVAALFRRGRAGGAVGVMSVTESGALRPRPVAGFVDDGVKPVFRVRTGLGREVRTTLSHPFLTPTGWRPLGQLTPGIRVAVPGHLCVFGSELLPEKSVLRLADRCAEAETAVPATVFRLTRDQVARFLHRLLVAPTTAPGEAVTLTSASRPWLRDVQHLLVRFGINAALRRRGPAWRLEITSATATRRFWCEIAAPDPLDPSDFPQTAAPQTARPASGPGTSAPDPPQPDTPDVTDVIWDEIVAITAEGETQVYDLTVPYDHNFVADDVVVHNTSFALGIASHAAMEAQVPVLMFSLEMSHSEITQRLLVGESRVDATRIRNGRLVESDWPKISQAIGRLGEAPLYIDDNPNLTVMEVRAKARRLKAKQGDLGLIIIDYLQLMSGRRAAENRQVEVSEISRGLKILARELEVPVIALSQLSRNLEMRADKRPVLADLRESGSLEQDADVVMFLYRDELYNPESPDRGTAEVIVSKHRNGPTGTTKLAFLDHFTRFANMARM